MGAVEGSHDSAEQAMQTGTTIGLDIAKSVFRAQGVDAEGLVVIRRQLVVIRRQLKRRYVLTFI